MSVVIVSSASSGSKLINALPRACGVPSGSRVDLEPDKPCRGTRRREPAYGCCTTIDACRRNPRPGSPCQPGPCRPGAAHGMLESRHALDVAAMGDGDDHVFALDQIFDVRYRARTPRSYVRRAWICELFAGPPAFHRAVIATDYVSRRGAGYAEKVLDNLEPRGRWSSSAILARSRPVRRCKAQIEDGAGLCLRQPIFSDQQRHDRMVRIDDQLDQRRHLSRSPGHGLFIKPSRAVDRVRARRG